MCYIQKTEPNTDGIYNSVPIDEVFDGDIPDIQKSNPSRDKSPPHVSEDMVPNDSLFDKSEIHQSVGRPKGSMNKRKEVSDKSYIDCINWIKTIICQ